MTEQVKRDNKKLFQIWMRGQSKYKDSPEIVVTILEESFSFANSHGLAKVSVWDLSTPMTYMNVCRRISGSHLFHVTQKLLARAFDRCHTIYCDFSKEQERGASRVASIQSDANANVPDQNKKIYDFDNPQPLPFSVPVSFSYSRKSL